MVMDIAVGDSDPVRSMRDVDKAIVVILVVVDVGRYINMVNPDVGRCLNADRVAISSQNLGDLQVLDDDVLGLVDVQTHTSEGGAGISADNGLVGANVDLCGTSDRALDIDDLGRGVCFLADGSSEFRQGRYGSGGTAFSTRSAAVLRSIADGRA